MSNSLPYSRAHHFGDIREKLFVACERLLLSPAAGRTPHAFPYISLQISVNEERCTVCLAAIPRGVLIETKYPDAPTRYSRLWMLEPFLGRISYIEIDNPVLRNISVFDRTAPEGNAYEMHAMPDDLATLQAILATCQQEVRHVTASPNIISPTIAGLLA